MATQAQMARTDYGNSRKKARCAGRDPDADPAVITAGRALNEANLEKHIREIVDRWPPLTPDQRDRLATILRGAA